MKKITKYIATLCEGLTKQQVISGIGRKTYHKDDSSPQTNA